MIQDTQKTNLLKDLSGFQKKLETMRGIASELVARWYGTDFQSEADNELVLDDLIGTDFEGLTVQNVYDIIGSLEAFETFCETHDENFYKVRI